MLETRRAFLQKLLIAATSIGLDPLRNVAIADDRYRNTRVGLSVRRPPKWEFSSVADFSSLRDRQVVIDLMEDEVHPLIDSTNLPLFIFEEPESRDGPFASAILLYDEALDSPAPRDQARAHKEVMLVGFGTSYQRFEILREPVVVKLQGAEGTWSQWSYLHELDSGWSRQLSIRSLVVFRAPRVHTYHFVESPTSAIQPETTWAEFIKSISYDELSEPKAAHVADGGR